MDRKDFKDSRQWVMKIGSALLTDEGRGLDREAIAGWVGQMAALRRAGLNIVLVSSGAVAEGMTRLGWQQRPSAISRLQAAAAVGQMGLVQAYESCFQEYDIHTAQILLDHDDLSNRNRYLNARSALKELLDLGVVPVVNENDTVVTDEIRFGDNDTLAALVANLIDADGLLILTDQDGLFDADPRINKDAKLIGEIKAQDGMLDEVAGGSRSELGLGGMITKVRAARLAARSGTTTVIASGRKENVLQAVLAGEEIGTVILPREKPMTARKQWLAGQLQMQGKLVLDDGAVKVLKQSGKSLLPVGVSHVEGDFNRGALVVCVDGNGQEIARGLVNYNADEARKIKGVASQQVEEVLGYQGEEELIHRDNLVVI
jgi:glutamate 5-kinase